MNQPCPSACAMNFTRRDNLRFALRLLAACAVLIAFLLILHLRLS
jgi:hypothetical protein